MKVPIQRELNASVTIAARDVLRYVRDWKTSLLFSFFFPIGSWGYWEARSGRTLAPDWGTTTCSSRCWGWSPTCSSSSR